MSIKTCLTAAAVFGILLAPDIALAQEEHMIGGKTVPIDQTTEIQDKCDTLRGHSTAPATNPTPSSPDNVTDGSSAASTADSGPASSSTTGAAGWTSDGSKIDLDSLTIAMCDEGNFVASGM